MLNESEVRIDGSYYHADSAAHVALNAVDNPLRDDRVRKIREHIGKVSCVFFFGLVIAGFFLWWFVRFCEID